MLHICDRQGHVESTSAIETNKHVDLIEVWGVAHCAPALLLVGHVPRTRRMGAGECGALRALSAYIHTMASQGCGQYGTNEERTTERHGTLLFSTTPCDLPGTARITFVKRSIFDI
jgi:hypothetical protein